jgi:hypothetical protein
MAPTRKSTDQLLTLALVMLTAAASWYAHAQAWGLGGRSPILSHGSAQVALAAREFAWRGHLATPFALPLDLVRHAEAPWPLSGIQPGLVLVEALIFKLAPAHGVPIGSDPRAWLTLIVPFTSYLMLGALGMFGARHLLARHAPGAPAWVRAGAPAAVGLMLVLDPEAQHFAISGLPEMPFTVLLLAAVLGLARGAGASHPFVLGLLLGVAGLLRSQMAWLAPVFALATAWSAPRGARVRALAAVLAGFALPLAPWWAYQWRAFGAPGWDVTSLFLWDQVEGRTWLELAHRPSPPDVPSGPAAWSLIAAKAWSNLGRFLPSLLEGPRGLWFGALAAWLLTRPARPLAAAGLALLAGLALGVLAACAGPPWLRDLFPVRVLAEAAGMLALWALVGRLTAGGPDAVGSGRMLAGLRVAVAMLALGWGLWLSHSARGDARTLSRERGVPSSRSLTALSVSLNEVLRPGETLMSNLGPSLAWQTSHPVIALAHAPADVPACRRRHGFRHVVLVFRRAERAWPAWQEIVERPGTAALVRELVVTRERRFEMADGFLVVWLELGPPPSAVAAR